MQERKGEVFGLLGPNGAGKTTAIHVIATLPRPTAGRVTVAGHDVVRKAAEVRKRIGTVLQNRASTGPSRPGRTCTYTAFLRPQRRGAEEKDKGGAGVRRALGAHEQACGELQRRDEEARGSEGPSSLTGATHTRRVHHGLDPHTRVRIWDYIRDVQKREGMTILLTNH